MGRDFKQTDYSGEVERAWRSSTGALHHVKVDHGSRHIGMAQQSLYGPDIDPAFEQVGRKRVAKTVGGCLFGDLGLANCSLDLALQRVFMQVIPGQVSGPGVGADFCR